MLTLNVLDALGQDLVEDLGVLERLLNLGNDGLCELLLLSGLDLALVANPRVKNCLGLSGKSSLLLELVCLGLKLGGFLRMLDLSPWAADVGTYLGNGEKVLGDIYDTAEVLDTANASLDSAGVVFPSSVQNALDLVVLVLGELRVHGTTVCVDSPVDCAQ